MLGFLFKSKEDKKREELEELYDNILDDIHTFRETREKELLKILILNKEINKNSYLDSLFDVVYKLITSIGTLYDFAAINSKTLIMSQFMNIGEENNLYLKTDAFKVYSNVLDTIDRENKRNKSNLYGDYKVHRERMVTQQAISIIKVATDISYKEAFMQFKKLKSNYPAILNYINYNTISTNKEISLYNITNLYYEIINSDKECFSAKHIYEIYDMFINISNLNIISLNEITDVEKQNLLMLYATLYIHDMYAFNLLNNKYKEIEVDAVGSYLFFKEDKLKHSFISININSLSELINSYDKSLSNTDSIQNVLFEKITVKKLKKYKQNILSKDNYKNNILYNNVIYLKDAINYSKNNLINLYFQLNNSEKLILKQRLMDINKIDLIIDDLNAIDLLT